MAIKLFELGYVVQAYDRASSVFKGITEKIEQLEGATKLGFGIGLDQLGEKFSAFGEHATEGLAGLVEAAADTQSQLAKLGAVTGWKSENLDQVREAGSVFLASRRIDRCLYQCGGICGAGLP